MQAWIDRAKRLPEEPEQVLSIPEPVFVPLEWLQRVHGGDSDRKNRQIPRQSKERRIPKQWLDKITFENNVVEHHRCLNKAMSSLDEEFASIREQWAKRAVEIHSRDGIDKCYRAIETAKLRRAFGSCLDGTDETSNLVLDAKIESRARSLMIPPLSPSPSVEGCDFRARCEAQTQIEISNRLLRC